MVHEIGLKATRVLLVYTGSLPYAATRQFDTEEDARLTAEAMGLKHYLLVCAVGFPRTGLVAKECISSDSTAGN